jgi:hydroxypyruvate isomerase
MTRRHLLATPAVALAAAPAAFAQAPQKAQFKQAVCRGCFRRAGTPMTMEESCKLAADLGIQGFDLIGPADWPTLKKYGLVPTMVPSASGIRDGVNRKEFHDKIETGVRKSIDQAAAAGAPNVIILSGERRGLSDEEGMDNCVAFYNRVKKHAEDKGVTLAMELLNSKVNHPDYQCDHTNWGVELCKRVGSPRVKLLYDIYHMQIMEGDVIRTIRDNHQWFAHYHTAGNPGRHELNDTQELYYPAIAHTLVEIGYTGFVAHEYTPLGDVTAGLKQAIAAFQV